jgi:hypothetical protein
MKRREFVNLMSMGIFGSVIPGFIKLSWYIIF